MANVGTIDAKVGLDLTELKKAQKETKTRMQNIAGNMKKAAKIGVKAAGVAFVALGTFSIKAASDMEETQAKFETAFKGIREQAEKTASSLANSYNMSQLESKKLLSGTGDLLKGFGFTANEALNLSSKVQALSADLASYNNLQGGTSRASDILTKAMLGEREALTSLGIKISEADVKQRLLEKGLQDLTGQALLAAKAQATFELAVGQSGDAIGDMARTSDSFANQMKELRANFNDLAVEMGEVLLPVANTVVTAFNNLFEAMNQRAIKNTKEQLEETKEEMEKFLETNAKILASNKVTDEQYSFLVNKVSEYENKISELTDELEELQVKSNDDVEIDFDVKVPRIEQKAEETGKKFAKGFKNGVSRFDLFDLTQAYAKPRPKSEAEGYKFAQPEPFLDISDRTRMFGGTGQAVERDTGAAEGFTKQQQEEYTTLQQRVAESMAEVNSIVKDNIDDTNIYIGSIADASNMLNYSGGVFRDFGNAIGDESSKLSELIEEIGYVFSDIGEGIMHIQNIAENFKTMQAAQGLGTIIPGLGVAAGVVGLIGTFFDNNNRKSEMEDYGSDERDNVDAIRENTEAIRGLNNSIFNLSRSVKTDVLRARTASINPQTGVV